MLSQVENNLETSFSRKLINFFNVILLPKLQTKTQQIVKRKCFLCSLFCFGVPNPLSKITIKFTNEGFYAKNLPQSGDAI